ncbi:hypothetical protein RvY_17772 [Ramazzottius varieornatus]|uniref:Brix domain-containing protein n=1 Tax=Ramazzottius varieornatus TaxID=947166 RepID=A0A1D1W933_RAMVA|nr:hypothetical protein RvY_17772 [Ramazzottius varieornatus]
MARKRKGRSQVAAKAKSATEPEELSRAPHTFVIKRGSVGRSVNNLLTDVRKVMEPYTASQLKVGKKNVMKDFVSVAGPLHVSHMMAFSKSEKSPFLRIIRIPRGPTLTFRIDKFSLMRDVVSSLKKPQNHPKQYDNPPLLVLNNFSTEKMETKLTTAVLQSMFPSLNVTKIKLNQVRRCVLFNYDPETELIEFRHYNVRAVPHGVSRTVRKIVKGKIPDMSRHQDIADFLSKGVDAAESEGEDNDPDNRVALPQDISTRGNMANQLSSIRLTELGPRMTLELIKIEEDISTGEVLYHKFIHKTEEEIKNARAARLLRQTRKADLSRQQERNVERKNEVAEEHREKVRQGIKRKFGEATQVVEEDKDDEYDDGYVEKEYPSDDDDEAWYEEEVGEKPEEGMLGNPNRSGFRRGGRGGRGRGFGRGRSFGRGGRPRGGGSVRFDGGSRDEGGGGYRGRSSDRESSRGRDGFRGSSRGGGGFRGSYRGGGRGSRGGDSGRSRGGDRGGRVGGRPFNKAIAFRRKSSSR